MKKQRFFWLKFSLLFLVMFILAKSAWATTVKLQWDPNTETDLAGYRVYYSADSAVDLAVGTGAAEGAAPIILELQTTATLSDLDTTKDWYFAVTAYNTEGLESSYSNIVSILTNLAAPSIELSQPNGTNTNPVCVTITDTNPVGTQYFLYYGATPPVGTTRVCSENTLTPCVPSTFLKGIGVTEGVSPIVLTSKNSCFNTTGVSATNSVAVTAYRSDNDNSCATNYKCESNISNVESYSIAPATPIYLIQTSAGANGTVTPSVVLSQGLSQTITMTPNACYKPNVTVDGIYIGSPLTYPFNNVIGNHTLSATFVPISYWVNVTSTTDGTVTLNGNSAIGYTTVACGSSLTLTFTPSVGYQIADVLIDGVSVGAVPFCTFNNVTASHTISATFASVKPVYRFRNKISGVYLYTADAGEISAVNAMTASWANEGLKYYVYMNQQPNTSPVYRFRNKISGIYLYTADAGEISAVNAMTASWANEGLKYYVYMNQQPNTSPVYRFRNKISGIYLYTADAGEISAVNAMTASWANEGLKYYVYMSP